MKLPAFLLIMLSGVAQAQLVFKTNSGSITITGYTGSPTVVNIPSTTNGYSVTSIGNGAFYNKSSLTGVAIPNSVTNIANSAFAYCSHLTSVTIPTNVASLGEYAFEGCSELANVTIPNSISNIEAGAFEACEDLANIAIPSTLTSIGSYAFGYCSDLASVAVPSSVTNIENYAFYYCRSLTNITVAAQNLFYSSAKGVLFDKNQTTLIQYPQYPGGTVGGYVISNSVTGIGPSAFQYCAGLTNITIPNSVTNLGDAPFYGCTHLAAITVGAGNSTYNGEAGVLFNKNNTIIIQYPPASPGSSYTISNSVTSIADYAFANSGLASIAIPNSVTNIETWAFGYCINLAGVTIGNGVTTIGDDAFDTCESLTNITMGNSVTTIGINAFEYCYSLTSVTIPYGVTSIGASAFYDCDNLTAVYFLGNAPFIYFNGPPCCELTLFYNDDNGTGLDPTTVYYLAGTGGWSSTYGGVSTAVWNAPTVVFTANPSTGTVPLSVHFTTPGADSGGNAITYWNWNFGDGATSISQNPSHASPTHVYTNAGFFVPQLLATNGLGAAVYGIGPGIVANPGPVYSGLVLNGGFETGDFTGWTLTGNASYTFVDNGSEITPFLGNYAAALGTSGSPGYLSQTLTTEPEANYLLSFWLANPSGNPGSFVVSWNGSTLLNDANPVAYEWTNFQFMVSATGTSTVLQFGFEDDDDFFGLDDISVTLLPVVLSAPNITVGKSNFVFLLSGPAGSNYVLQVSTNLLNWSSVSTSAIPVSGNLSLTNATTGYNRRFYRVRLQ